jgi:hypothetical protein
MQKIKLSIVAAFAVLGLGLVASPAYAACSTPAQCAQAGVDASGGSKSKADVGDLIKKIVNIMLFILGAIAVIMVVLGGIKYTLSGGDSSAVSSAKNTILYAIVGLVVAIMAYAIVNFVLNSFI